MRGGNRLGCSRLSPLLNVRFVISRIVHAALENARNSCPASSGCFSIFLSSPLAKNISLYRYPKSEIESHRPTPQEGRLAIVTDVGVGCGGRNGVRRACARWTKRLLRTAKPCGPDAPTLASSWRVAISAGDGGKRARSPGRARSKP